LTLSKFPAINEFTILILKTAQQRLKVYENRLLKKIFVPRRDKVRGIGEK
jgi:hypothetical protein